MNFSSILLNSLWAALFAMGLGILLSAPFRYLIPTFLCGFAGRFIRDISMGWGMSQNWSTVVASAVLVLLAVVLTKRHRISPVVLICGVLPLGAAVAVFNMIFDLLKVSSFKGDALIAASAALSENISKAFTGTLAIALGLAAGMAIVQLCRREGAEGE
jgi:uncharacterized membrane protein YjjB (DUF3815 family)